MGDLFTSSNTDILFETHRLEEDEFVKKSWAASLVWFSIFTRRGGRLILTNKRVLFEPLNMKVLSLLPMAKYFMPFIGEQGSTSISEIARVEILPGRVARMRLISKRSTHVDFLVMARYVSPIWSGKNKAARDDAVAEINRAIGIAPEDT
jgi:hypothetical protein